MGAELLGELGQESICRGPLERMVAALFQIASQLGELRRWQVFRGIEQCGVKLGRAVCIHQTQFGNLGIELELHTLQQHGVVDLLLASLPAQLSVTQHQLHALAFELSAVVELVEDFEHSHGVAGGALGFRPGVPAGSPLGERFGPLRVGSERLDNGLAVAGYIPLGAHAWFAGRIQPALLQPFREDWRRRGRIGQSRSADGEQRAAATRVSLIRGIGIQQHLANHDARMHRQYAQRHRPLVLGQRALQRRAALGIGLEEPEQLAGALAVLSAAVGASGAAICHP